jgi:Transmembrane secretion effector
MGNDNPAAQGDVMDTENGAALDEMASQLSVSREELLNVISIAGKRKGDVIDYLKNAAYRAPRHDVAPVVATAFLAAQWEQDAVRQSSANPLHPIFRHRDFRLLWSLWRHHTNERMVQSITLGWLALNLTNRAAFVGQVNALPGLPLLLLSLPAGALLDRVDRRSTLLVCQAVGAVVAIAIASIIYSSALAPWHLLAAASLNGILLAVSVPTLQALGPARVARSDLTSAVAVSVAGNSSTRIAAVLAWLMRIDITLRLFGFSSCLGISHNALTSALLQARMPNRCEGKSPARRSCASG